MAYPSLHQLEGSSVRVVDDREVVRATNGTARASAFFDTSRRSFVLQHKLSAADLTTLYAHYEANRTASFDFTWALDGATYTVIYGANGIRVNPRAVHHDVTVELEEVD